MDSDSDAWPRLRAHSFRAPIDLINQRHRTTEWSYGGESHATAASGHVRSVRGSTGGFNVGIDATTESAAPPVQKPESEPEPAPDPNRFGQAGASAKREFERRRQRDND